MSARREKLLTSRIDPTLLFCNLVNLAAKRRPLAEMRQAADNFVSS